MKKILIACALFCTLNAGAQTIPNAGFETWSTTGPFPMPTSWAGAPTVHQSNSAHSGTYAVVCTVDTFTNPATTTLDTLAGQVYSGAATMGPPVPGANLNGFALAARPDSLTGFYKYRAMGADTLRIEVMLSKWNTATMSRDAIANAAFMDFQNDSNYKRFSIPLNYTSASTPDTCVIVLSCASPQGPKHMGTSLWVDDLAFANHPATGITALPAAQYLVYPNPFTSVINVSAGKAVQQLDLYSNTGKKVATATSGTLPAATLPSGMYLLQITTETGTETIQINKQ
jgi:hypothetical protein